MIANGGERRGGERKWLRRSLSSSSSRALFLLFGRGRAVPVVDSYRQPPVGEDTGDLKLVVLVTRRSLEYEVLGRDDGEITVLPTRGIPWP